MSGSGAIRVPGAPDVPGLVFRTYGGEADLPRMVAVREGSREHDRVDPRSAREAIPTVEDLRHQYADMGPGYPNLLIVEVGGEVVGYVQLVWWTEGDGVPVYLHLGWLLPAWRGRGIGRAMLRWSQRRLGEIRAREEQPANPKATFATNVSSTEREAEALMLSEGYAPVRRLSDMALGDLDRLPPAELPTALVVRPVFPEHHRAIYRAYKDAWAGLAPATPEDEADYREFLADNAEAPGADPSLWQVAWDGEEVAGFVILRVRDGVGTVPEVAVRKRWKRQGVARALMVRGLRALRERGVAQVRLYTNAAAEQGARSLYEGLGFREVKQHAFYRKPMDPPPR